MEGIDKLIIDKHIIPYPNHYGNGNYIGAGTFDGCGYGNINTSITDNYDGSGIVSFNKHTVYHINGFTLYISHIHEPWISGEIINNDFTTQSCYLFKVNNKVFINTSLRLLLSDIKEGILKSPNNIEDIATAFVSMHPNYNQEYPWDEMVAWHSLSPRSCLDGRRRFSKKFNKNSQDKCTPKELISCMKQSPSKDIGIAMEQIYLEKEKLSK